MKKLHLPHAIVDLADVVVLTSQKAGSIGVWAAAYNLSVEFSTQDETMDVAQPAPQGAHYHANTIYSTHLTGVYGIMG